MLRIGTVQLEPPLLLAAIAGHFDIATSRIMKVRGKGGGVIRAFLIVCVVVAVTVSGANGQRRVESRELTELKDSLLKKAKEGSLDAAATLIEMNESEYLKELDLKSAPIAAWKASDARAGTMTARQVYGFLLSSAEAPADAKERKHREEEVIGHLTSSEGKNGIILYRLAYVLFGDEEKSTKAMTQAIALLRNPPKDAHPAIRGSYLSKAYYALSEWSVDIPLATRREWAIIAADGAAAAFAESGQELYAAFILRDLGRDLALLDTKFQSNEKAFKCLEQSAAIFQARKIYGEQADSLRFLGLCKRPDHTKTGTWAGAADAYARAAAAAENAKDYRKKADFLLSQANCLDEGKLERPDYIPSEKARALLMQAVQAAEKTGDENSVKFYREYLDRRQ